MSASELDRAEWLDPRFWDRLDRLESHRLRSQSEHNEARRRLERLGPHESAELGQAWRSYCDAIAQLDRAVGEFEALRSGAE